MTISKVMDPELLTKPDEQEELFILKIQGKQEVITAIMDSGS